MGLSMFYIKINLMSSYIVITAMVKPKMNKASWMHIERTEKAAADKYVPYSGFNYYLVSRY